MTNDDDLYQHFQCSGALWRDAHVRMLFSDSGSILLGASRVFAFLLLFALNWYNRRLLRSKAQDNMNVVPGLVLPYYFRYIYLYIGFSLLTGIVDIALQMNSSNGRALNLWLLPIEQGVFHWIYEGLAFFLMRYGAGVKAFQRALLLSGLWGVVSFVIFFVMFALFDGAYGFASSSKRTEEDAVYALYVTYNSLLLVFYGTFLVVPAQRIYRRKALEFYARFNVLLCVFSIVLISLLYFRVTDVVCVGSVLSFLLVAFIQPLVLFRVLQMDSQYWQGLQPEQGNPLAQVWDHVDLATAQSMAENLENVQNTQHNSVRRQPLPVLHYGLLDFDENEHYVAGGFSRVYFGKLRKERVAFKILFAMELTPEDVLDFYEEAALLYALSHENVVVCHGICVMPPALTMVLEHCVFGSLYDFLYKPLSESERERLVSLSLSHKSSSTLSESTVKRESGVERESVVNPLSETHTQSVQVSPPSTPNPPSHKYTRRRQRYSTGRLSMDIELGTRSMRPSETHSERESESVSARASLSLLETGRRWIGRERERETQRESVSASHDEFERDSECDNNPHNSHSQHTHTTHRSSISRVYKTYETLTQLVMGRKDSAIRSPTVYTAAHTVSYERRLRMMCDAARAIAFLHSKGFMHCDIKSLNFLVDANYRVKLADMGEVRAIVSDKVYALPPIPARNWAPPEVISPNVRAESYTPLSEVYGLCLVLIELITLELPFGDLPDRLNPQQWYERLVVEGVRPALPSTLDERIAHILQQGTLAEPTQRPSAAEVLRVLEEVVAQNTTD